MIKAFDTPVGVPNVRGVIPAGSTITVTLWMNKSANYGTMYPQAKLRLNSATGSSLCTATGATALTKILTQYTLACVTASDVIMATTDRFYLSTGINLTVGPGAQIVYGQLRIEGILNGNYDSRVVIPNPTPLLPTISSLSPSSGAIGIPVTISGSDFGSTTGAVTFNGTSATPSSWSNTTIVAPAPIGTTSGPVIVTTAGGLTSNGVNFKVVIPGYLYDELGRLMRAISPNGTVVTYSISNSIMI